ncbi:unnamed protein product [Ectocarpus sp. CCAP 1310/34]|nr:unnamed protein product [Ectocarpus sp. CCAP 1310/34]
MKGNLYAATWRALKAACKGVYQHLKRSVGLGGRLAGGQHFVADENSVLLRSKNDILRRWARFFGTLPNTKSPTLHPDIIEQVTQRPATRATRWMGAALDLEEVERATNGLQNRKAPGNDSLHAELLKIDNDDEPIVLEYLHTILVIIVWNEEEIPQEWKDATIKVLYNKGDHFNCNNFRGISLLSHVGKVPVKIITNRLSTFCETNNTLPEEQCGFRPVRYTIDMLAGIAEEMIAAIRLFHDGMRARARIDDGRHFGLVLGHTRLRKGCVRSQVLLFNIFSAAVVEVVVLLSSEDDVILQSLVYLAEGTGAGAGTPLNQVRRAVWGMLDADDAGVVSRSADGLARTMAVIVEVFA